MDIKNQEIYIKEKIKIIVERNNSDNSKNFVDISKIYINEYISVPGVRGCVYKDGSWYTYYVDDRCQTLLNGPYSYKGVIVALSIKLFIPDEYQEEVFLSEELDTFLKGEVPVDVFNNRGKKVF